MNAFVLCPLLIGSAVQGPDLTQALTYETVAVPASRVLAEVSKLVKIDLVAAPQVADDVLVVSVKGAPLGELMNRIAVADSAEWTKTAGGYRLGPNLAKRNSEASAEEGERLAALQRSIKDWTDRMSQVAKSVSGATPNRGADGQTADTSPSPDETMFALNPVTHSVIQLLSELDLAPIAALGLNERIVYSSNPTRMQRSLGAAASGVFERLVARHNDEVARGAGVKSGSDAVGIPPDVLEILVQTPKKIEVHPALGLLIAERDGRLGLRFAIELYARDGKGLLSESSYDFATRDISYDEQSAPPAKEGAGSAESKPARPSTKIEYSALTPELVGLDMDRLSRAASIKAPSDELLARLKAPDKYDPLSFAASERLIQTGQHRSLNLVAALPDNFERVAESGAPTVERTMDMLARAAVCRGAPDGGWLVVRPATPYQARLDRLDRRSLSKLISGSLAKRIASLDDFATFALKNDDAAADVGLERAQFLVPTGSSPVNQSNGQDWDMMRLYGTLSEAQRLAIGGQSGLPLGALSRDQALFAQRLLFGFRQRLKRTPEAGAKKLDPIIQMIQDSSQDRVSHESLLEPTEAMPDGMPPDGNLTMEVTRSFFMVPTLTPHDQQALRSGGSFDSLGPIELAMFKIATDNPNLPGAGDQMPRIEKGKFGAVSNLKFAFHVAPKIVSEHLLTDSSIDKSARLQSLDSMTEEQKAEVAKWVDAFKKSPFLSFLEQMSNQGKQAIPPR